MTIALCHFYSFRLLGYEGLEVVNPEGGTEDAEEEAQKGRWKQEVCLALWFLLVVIYLIYSLSITGVFF